MKRQITAFAALLMMASSAVAQTATGAYGTGGEASGGAAQGFRFVFPSPRIPGATVTNQGTLFGGHVVVRDANGNVIGTLNGWCEQGGDIYRGSGTGIFAAHGDRAGIGTDDDVFLPC
jgi:hypothetical protein